MSRSVPKKKTNRKSASGTSIVARAPAGALEIVPLTKPDKTLLAEAQRRAVSLVRDAEGAIAGYGEWLFATLFGGDAKAVLDEDGRRSGVYRALLQSAGTAKMPLSKHALSVSLRIAAYDRRLADGAWSALRFTHKEKLLRLVEPKAMRAAARHVLAGSLSVDQTQAYVRGLIGEGETEIRLTPTRARRAVLRAGKPFLDARYLARMARELGALEGEPRGEVVESLEKMSAAIQRLLAALEQ